MENQPSTLRRIPLPDAREFEHQYMHSVTPVVITDLFRGNAYATSTRRNR